MDGEWNVFRRGSTELRATPDDDVMGVLSGLTFNLLILIVFIAVVYVALRIAQSIFGTDTKKAAATEVAAKLVSYPTGSSAVLRRRFARALTGQHVIMPSGERLAFGDLVVRVAPEDLVRLDPDGDLERLGADGARLYVDHAEQVGWAVPPRVTVTVKVDGGLRSGWIPPARGTGRAEPRTATFSAMLPDLEDTSPTMNVAMGLRLERKGESYVVGRAGAVLGRLAESAVPFDEPEVSTRHAAIRLLGTTWQIKDLGSTNGTTVDGQRIDGDDWTTITGGAVIKLAGVTIVAALDTAGTVHLQGLTGH